MTTSVPSGRRDARRRASAALALTALAAAVLFLVVVSIRRWDVLLVSVVSLGLAVVAAWYVVSRRGSVRVAAAVLAVIALAVFVAVILASQSGRVLAVGLALGAISTVAAGYALAPEPGLVEAESAPRARHAVLIMNPRSGGGKVERFGLVDLCRQRDVEPHVLGPGDDLREVAEAAVARGAELLGMAGGDGSLAIVASIASRHGLPFVVVPAGTRNHFALDLGIDREDVPGALEAFDDGVDTRVDLAELNGRVFVNNASMGVYAKVVQSADYREAKVQTASAMLPDMLGPGARPLDLRYTLPSGEQAVPGQLLLVSNNPYDLAHLRGGGTRERLDGGVLGIVSLRVSSAADAEKVAALEMTGQVQRFAGWNEWTASEFDVTSDGPVEVGVDGEALVLDPPLHFAIRPGAVTVRLPRAAVRRRAGARQPARITAGSTLTALWETATGRQAQAG
ncbi:diacylglycerol kinase [Intrasporangium oryzae NRRL B-24470]|uniref:Diacylglycerol kinase n=1 Tax=Intrasporangium oryzae NRRL B-24470 TaxID=1386089 RepID=W9G6V5_9MICO|nr:diacylglycerol kinase family protein [Intrasporangium oryzae]EWT01926.1 diacylglycerol kinase [Intrasporangium oryzae NRRL B-24470]